ncbi:MAG: hypothetical protein U0641_05780 [Anaerolineae bacterium]
MTAICGIVLLVWLLGLFSGKINTFNPSTIFEQVYIYLGYVVTLIAFIALFL